MAETYEVKNSNKIFILKLEDKIKIILNLETNEEVRLLGSFLKQSFLLRTRGSYM